MIPLSWTLTAGAALAAFIAGGAGAWKVQAWRFDAARTESVERAAKDLARAVETQDRAVADYIANRQKAEADNEEVIRYVDKIVERPVYRNVCIDADGMRAFRAAIDGSPLGPEPGAAVPQPPLPR